MRVSGQFTVFFSLLLISLLSLLLVILESARSSAIQFRLALAADSALDSTFAGYQKELLEEYGLFFLWDDNGRIEGTVTDYFTTYFQPPQINGKAYGMHPYPAAVSGAEILQKVSMNDRGGEILRAEITRSLGISIGQEWLEDFLSFSGLLTEGEQIYEEVREGSKDILSSIATDEVYEGEVETKFFDQVAKAIGQSGLTNGVFRGQVLSGKSLETEQLPSKVWMTAGEPEKGILDSLTLNYYISQYFSAFTDEKKTFRETNGLAYEQEYILNGFPSDEENIKAAAGKLLVIREGMNLLHIYRDTAKVNLADGAATVLAVLLEAPGMKESIKILIMTLWAYQEAITDLKTLLDSGKVPLFKEKEDWQTGLGSFLDFDIGLTEEDGAAGKKTDKGFSYEEYLGLLLWTEGQKEKLYRIMDLLQANYQNRFPGFSVQNCYSALEVKVYVQDYRGRSWRVTKSRNYI